MNNIQTIAIIGGTGALGVGLAMRLARAGYEVVIGSRTSEKASRVAAEIVSETDAERVRGVDNVTAAQIADLVIVTVPFASQAETLRSIASEVKGKIVVDTTVPLVPPKVARVQLPQAGSAAAIAAQVLGVETRLVTAFHNVSAQKLRNGRPVGCDVLVFGDNVEAREVVVGLVARLGMRALHGGPLANAVAVEALTSVLISINKRYQVVEGAGVCITGIDKVAGGG